MCTAAAGTGATGTNTTTGTSTDTTTVGMPSLAVSAHQVTDTHALRNIHYTTAPTE